MNEKKELEKIIEESKKNKIMIKKYSKNKGPSITTKQVFDTIFNTIFNTPGKNMIEFNGKDAVDIIHSGIETLEHIKKIKNFKNSFRNFKKRKNNQSKHEYQRKKDKYATTKYYRSTLSKNEKFFYKVGKKISNDPIVLGGKEYLNQVRSNIPQNVKLFLREKYNIYNPKVKDYLKNMPNTKLGKMINFGKKSLGFSKVVFDKIDKLNKVYSVASSSDKGKEVAKILGAEVGSAVGKGVAAGVVAVFPELVPVAPIISTGTSLIFSKLGEKAGEKLYDGSKKIFAKPSVKSKQKIKEKKVKINKVQKPKVSKKQSIRMNDTLPSMTQLLNNLSKSKKNTKRNSKGSTKELNMRELSRLVANDMAHNVNLRLANM